MRLAWQRTWPNDAVSSIAMDKITDFDRSVERMTTPQDSLESMISTFSRSALISFDEDSAKEKSVLARADTLSDSA
jgi:hypothetical protein